MCNVASCYKNYNYHTVYLIKTFMNVLLSFLLSYTVNKMEATIFERYGIASLQFVIRYVLLQLFNDMEMPGNLQCGCP